VRPRTSQIEIDKQNPKLRKSTVKIINPAHIPLRHSNANQEEEKPFSPDSSDNILNHVLYEGR